MMRTNYDRLTVKGLIEELYILSTTENPNSRDYKEALKFFPLAQELEDRLSKVIIKGATE